MKVTDAEIIKDSEQDLIDAINGDLDWGVLEKIFVKEHGLGIGEDVAYKEGDIVVHEGKVAYRLEFEVKVTMAVLLDRDGRYIEMAITDNNLSDDLEDDASESEEPESDGPENIENDEQLALDENKEAVEHLEPDDESVDQKTTQPDEPEKEVDKPLSAEPSAMELQSDEYEKTIEALTEIEDETENGFDAEPKKRHKLQEAQDSIEAAVADADEEL
jgi:hypothetical protein